MTPKSWRLLVGYSASKPFENFLKATDVKTNIDYDALIPYADRVRDILRLLNQNIHEDAKHADEVGLIESAVDRPAEFLRTNDLVRRFRNYGRAPSDVYFSWLRGYAIAEFLLPAMSALFEVAPDRIEKVGGDRLRSPDDFEQSATADYIVRPNSRQAWRIEIQSGFATLHDIKKHKFDEAQRVLSHDGQPSAVLHFDVLNGRVALVALHARGPSRSPWVVRRQFEGQQVVEIPESAFTWSVVDQPVDFSQPSRWATI